MLEARLGEIAALLAALCWTFGALGFEIACKRSSSLAVNWIRLSLGFIFLCILALFSRGLPLPTDASSHAWLWLALSGLVGFTLGDMLLFRAFAVLGARISMLVMSAVPPFTAVIGWIVLGETLTPLNLVGMALTVTGIVLVVLDRGDGESGRKLAHPVAGVLMAVGAAAGQSIGLVLSKLGMGDYYPMAATQIRLIAGILGFSLIFSVTKRWASVWSAVRDKITIKFSIIGALLGTALGVTLSLVAVQNTVAGVASTIMAIVPVLIIPPAILFMKEKVTVKEIVGAFIAVVGVGILFL